VGPPGWIIGCPEDTHEIRLVRFGKRQERPKYLGVLEAGEHIVHDPKGFE